MTKIEWWSQEPTRRERKEKNYLKSKFEKVQFCLFEKPDSRVLIGRKSASTGRNRQRLPLSNFKNFKNFDRSKNRMDQSSQAEAHHIFEEKHNF